MSILCYDRQYFEFYNGTKARRRRHMPFVIIEAFEGRTVEQKRGLVKDVTEAICKNFEVNPDAVSILIHELKRENLGKAGKLTSDS
ncbi:2-hydroxymuconate tautomerase [Chloroflexota bacterium]